jgi:Flp pilus assembly protein TadD, contains TPR repeats
MAEQQGPPTGQTTKLSTAAQQYIVHYTQHAQDLNASQSIANALRVLQPLHDLPEDEQISLLKELGKKNDQAAADLMQAVLNLSDNKKVRKEARSRIIQLESKDIYSDWTVPQERDEAAFPRTMNSLLTSAQKRDSEDEDLLVDEDGDDDDDDDDDDEEGDEIDEMAELSEMFASLINQEEPEYVSVVEEFITAWTDGDYDAAYAQLSNNSPLREGLSEEEWIKRRQQWASVARPQNVEIRMLAPLKDEQGQELSVIDASWSLQLATLPTATLPELPTSTLEFTETGRHWFWTRYTTVQSEDGEWLISTMNDEGANVLHQPRAVLEEHIQTLDQQIQTLAEEEEKVGKDEEATIESVHHFLSQRLPDMSRLLTWYLHTNDALIAQDPQGSQDRYGRAFSMTGVIDDLERGAVYAQQAAEHTPEVRGVALRNLAYTYMMLAEQADKDDRHEQADQFLEKVEPLARQALQAEDNPKTRILLGSLLIEDEDIEDNPEKLKEAESCFRIAEKGPNTKGDIIEIEQGLAQIAEMREESELALHHYQNLTHLEPDNANHWQQVGLYQSELNHYKEAEEAIKRAIDLDPELEEAYSILAYVYTSTNQLAKARETIRTGVDYNPDSALLNASLAMTYLASGDIRSARKYQQRAEQLDPDDDLVQELRQLMKHYKFEHPSQSSKKKSKQGKHKKR